MSNRLVRCPAIKRAASRCAMRRAWIRAFGVAGIPDAPAFGRASMSHERHIHETAARDRTHPFRRDRRHRHERHRRGAVQSRLHRAGLGRVRERQCQRGCATRASRSCVGHKAENVDGADVRRGLDRDQARQSGTDGGARPAHPGGAPRRNAGRTDAAEKLRRDRRHPWQDHHHLDGRGAARCRRVSIRP